VDKFVVDASLQIAEHNPAGNLVNVTEVHTGIKPIGSAELSGPSHTHTYEREHLKIRRM
jgi:hypothetical protein